MTAAEVRQAAFPLVRRGYAIAAVDAALGRIEDAFAAREREAAVSTRAARTPGSGRPGRPRRSCSTASPGRRAAASTGSASLRYGYRIDEVDLVADKLARYLETGDSVTVEQVRAVAFRMQRGGYREAQVDAVLDAVIEVMLAVA